MTAEDRPDEWPRIVVAMATFRRPECLSRILPELSRQVARYRGDASILVVDNDPDGGAADYVRGWADRRVRYVHEPEPGIAAARNCALDHAGDADAAVFVDDDELPLSGWLDTLVSHWVGWRCAGVVGPVQPRFEGADPGPWVSQCGVFDRQRRTTGATVGGAATNNLLLDLGCLRDSGLRFDQAYGLSGGSDSRLTRALTGMGHQIRWCDEAEVLDFIPPDRATPDWVKRRTWRTGNVWSRVTLDLQPSPVGRARQRFELTVRGVVRIVRGLALSVRGRLTADPGQRGRGACTIQTGLGVIAGAVGHTVVEYRRDQP